MEPLLDENAERSCNKCDDKTQHPSSIDDGVDLGLLERWSGEIWDCRIDEVSVDGKM